MAVEKLSSAAFPWRVSVYIPNEVEGQILGGTQTHASVTSAACQTLTAYARRQLLPWLVRQETLILYPRIDGSTGSLSPDCLVALGIDLPDDVQYHMVEVGRPPDLVIEIVSRKTSQRDKTLKIQAYAQLGIQEYIIFDPRPRKGLELKGFRLASHGLYMSMTLAPEGGFWLATVGLRVLAEPRVNRDRAPRLRFFTPAGEPLPHPEEEAALRQAEQEARMRAEQTAQAEREARTRAEQAAQAEREARTRAEQDRDADRAELVRLRTLLALGDRPPSDDLG